MAEVKTSIDIGGSADTNLLKQYGKLTEQRSKDSLVNKENLMKGDLTSKIANKVGGSLIDAVQGIGKKKEQEEVDRKKGLKPFQDAAKKTFKKLYEQKEPMP